MFHDSDKNDPEVVWHFCSFNVTVVSFNVSWTFSWRNRLQEVQRFQKQWHSTTMPSLSITGTVREAMSVKTTRAPQLHWLSKNDLVCVLCRTDGTGFPAGIAEHPWFVSSLMLSRDSQDSLCLLVCNDPSMFVTCVLTILSNDRAAAVRVARPSRDTAGHLADT